jgi:hypothetical protein
VTQHVIAETLSPLRGWLKVHSEAVREGGISLVRTFDLEELPCRIRDLAADEAYRKVLVALGPTDAGLLWVAKSVKATLISDDGDLLPWAHHLNVPAYSVREIPALAQSQ